MKSSPFLNDDPEVRRAEAVFEEKQWLEGHRSQIGLAIFALATLGNWAGFKVPQDEINSFITLLGAHWDGIMQVAGGAFALYGIIMKGVREKRLKKAVVVQAVLKDRVQEKLDEKKDELIETRTKLVEALKKE